MGLLSFTDEELAAGAAERAAVAWAAGHPVFVDQIRAGVGSKNSFGHLLTLVISAGVEVGWQLRSVTPYINTIGPNNHEALVVFDRPGGLTPERPTL